jgi:RNA recognition motif-containing protein
MGWVSGAGQGAATTHSLHMGEALSCPEGPEGSSQESVLLSQLIQLLQQRERNSLLLSDLGALLPGTLRQRVKDQGGLQSWLQRFPSLFSVTGTPGKETVTLCLGANTQQIPQAVEAETSSATAELDLMKADADADGAAAEEDIDAQSAVQLRGLPYRATVENIVTFLGEHSSDLSESNAVQLVQNRDGRPSGFARVQFSCPESARRCVQDLHLRSMDDRYVEVFLWCERPSKGRQRRGGHEEGTATLGDAARQAVAVDVSGVTRDQVVQECRAEMADAKKRRILLSMLGVALSPGARSYLKQMDQGLKHFLSQYPSEFSVDGGKGCEYVTYAPTQLSLSDAIDGFDASIAVTTEASITASPKSASAAVAASPEHPAGPASATWIKSTPSDWGSPGLPPGVAPFIPPWPQGAPGAPADANAWSAFAQVPGGQYNWPGWPGYPPWDLQAAAAAAAAFATPPGMASASAVTQQAVPGHQPDVSTPAVPPVLVVNAPIVAAVRLRGLPFQSAEQDVLAFFAQHDIVDRIADGPDAVKILTRSNGRPSGQAIVRLQTAADAELSQSMLHGQWMGSRYIEVFLLTEEENTAQATGAGATAFGTSPSKSNTHEPISLSMGVPAPTSMPESQQMSVPTGMSGPAQDMNGQFPGMAPSIPPWQLGMWSAAMSGGMPGGAGALGTEFGGIGQEHNPSWEALFEFLGPDGAAGIPPPMFDFSAMGLPGAGFVPDAMGMPPMMAATATSDTGAPAAASV